MAKEYKYHDYQQDVLLCKGIADIHPYELRLPDLPEDKTTITNYGLHPDQQFFKREVIPIELKKIDQQVKAGQITRERGIELIEQDPKLAEFVEMLWRKRTGEQLEFQYIGGHPIHISHTYWLYLNFWEMPQIGADRPEFRHDWYHHCTDLSFFYYWDYLVVPSPFALGSVEFTQRQVGKCLQKDTPIIMYDGSVKMVQDIVEGDLLMGDDSTERKAFGITTGREPMYKITPHHGDSFTCNQSHILTLYHNNIYREASTGWAPKSYVEITVKDYLNLSNTAKNHLCLYRTGWGNNWKNKEHYIDPYILGIYLGDGGKDSGNITNPDKEVIGALSSFCKDKGLVFKSKNILHRMVRSAGMGMRNPYTVELRNLNVLPSKHIPSEYLNDGRENRLQLLAGLLDTDGYLGRRKTKNGYTENYEITQKDKNMSYQILTLARSLGFNASIKSKIATLKREGKETYKCTVYRVTIFGDIHLIPCKIERKKASVIKKRNNPLNSGFKIECVGEGDYYGFAVDKNHLFLLGDGTVVHNSYKMGVILYDFPSRNYEGHSGMQSKTDDDAAKIFTKCIVKPWRKLPFFFQPICSNSTMPKAEGLNFSPRSKRGKEDSTLSLDEDELMGTVTYRASGSMAYDGDTLDRFGNDESGKCLALNTPILMYDGSIKMVQDVVNGDLLMGDDSLPRKVMSTTTGKEEMYEVVPNKGMTWGCNKSHILSLRACSSEYGYKEDEIVNIPVYEYEKLSEVKQKDLVLWRVKGLPRVGFKLVKKGIGDYYGFTITGNHLFLLGDYTVTHNTTVADVYERLTVVRETLRRRGGKAYFTTTVEEMEKMGGKFFKRLWIDSDRSPIKKSMEEVKVDSNGETVSGLWPWFTPSYCNEHFDQFGFSIVDKITEKQKAYLKSVAGLKKIKYWWMTGLESVDHQINMQKDQHKKQEVIRKKPRNIKEAFASSNNFSHFNKSILNARLSHFTYGYTPKELEHMRFGRFKWVNDIFGGEVEFVDMAYDQARCHISYMPREGMRNQKVPMAGGKYRPANAALFRSGADPFKYDTPDVKNPSKMSDGAQHIYAFFDPSVDGNKDRKDWLTNNFIYEYLYRPESVDELCEDYLKACIFYGCKLYPERNNDDVIKYFKKHGFEHYIQMGIKVTASVDTGIYYTQETVGGNITNDKTIQKMFRHVDDFVNNDAAHCVFHRTLQDILDVEKENLNPFDLFVSASYTLMAAYESEIANKQVEKPGAFDDEALRELNGYDIN